MSKLVRAVKSYLRPQQQPIPFQRASTFGTTGTERDIARARNVLNYGKTGTESYSGGTYPGGYQSIEVHGQLLKGQRQPAQRLAPVPYDFSGKRVVDLGCNQGGMLHHLAGDIKWGVGFDYDPKLVNAANTIRQIGSSSNLSFFVFDLDREPLDIIIDFLPEEAIDIIFLLSICMWLDRWTEVVRFAAARADTMLFETNGNQQQQREQEALIRELYANVVLLAEQSADDPGKKSRRLMLCTR